MDSDSIRKEDEECEELVIDISRILEPAQWPECCIYRIPKRLRKINEEAYIPKTVSIGPFHHHLEELRDMEMQKLRYLRDFCLRTGTRQNDLLKIIKDNEDKIRRCYSETFEHIGEEFVQMILLDSIFIIELFSRTYQSTKNDYISSQIWLQVAIQCDLVLLENQLPFFILEKLYMFAVNEESKQTEEHKKDLKKHLTFVDLSRRYFGRYDKQPGPIIGEEVKHFTDLIRYLFCSVPRLTKVFPKILDNLYSATKLHYAGLKFVAVEKRALLDITLSQNEFLVYFPCFNLSWLLSFLPCLKCFPYLGRMQSILEVPTLPIYDSTEALFRNLMALEECHYPFDTYISDYVKLINYLIKTEKDVDLLVEKRVIVNYIGSNGEVATLFNKLGIQIWERISCYNDLSLALKKYYEHPWNHTLAVLRNTYFRDFGRSIATVAALLTLVGLFVPFVTDIGSKRN